MNDVLMHHGILGQKWGVRRTPEQLGHVSGNNSAGNKVKAKTDTESISKKKRSVSSLSDEELRQRIQRLNMEEQYSSLVARQKDRDTSKLKKMAVSALESLGQKGFDYAIGLAADKLFNKKGEFTIADLENADVKGLDQDTLKYFSQMCKDADTIVKFRNKTAPRHDEKKSNEPFTSTRNQKHDEKSSQSRPTVTKTSETDAFIPPVSNRVVSIKMPRQYRKAGTAR